MNVWHWTTEENAQAILEEGFCVDVPTRNGRLGPDISLCPNQSAVKGWWEKISDFGGKVECLLEIEIEDAAKILEVFQEDRQHPLMVQYALRHGIALLNEEGRATLTEMGARQAEDFRVACLGVHDFSNRVLRLAAEEAGYDGMIFRQSYPFDDQEELVVWNIAVLRPTGNVQQEAEVIGKY